MLVVFAAVSLKTGFWYSRTHLLNKRESDRKDFREILFIIPRSMISSTKFAFDIGLG